MQELKTSGRIDLTVVPLYSFQRLSRDYDDNAVFRRDSDTALSNYCSYLTQSQKLLLLLLHRFIVAEIQHKTTGDFELQTALSRQLCIKTIKI